MKSNKSRNLIRGLVLLCLVAAGCGKSLTDTNVNPNEVSDDQVNPAYIMTQALGQSATQVATWAMAGNVTESVLSELMQYSQRDYLESAVTNTYNWLSKSWDGAFYLPLANASYLGMKAKNSADSVFLRGVSLVLTSYWFGYYTSAWGDVPYSEAIQGPEGIMRPAFDQQPDIFKGILEDLSEANDILKDAPVSATTTSADVLYGGDLTKWRAFANSLRLRFLMRLSGKEAEMKAMGVDIKAVFNQIASDPTNYPIITASADNAALSFPGTAAVDSWPLGPLNKPDRSEFYRRKPGATIVDILRENSDPRLTVWFNPVEVQTRIGDRGGDKVIVKDSDGQIRRYFKAYKADLDTNRYVGMGIAMPDPDSRNEKDQTQVTAAAALNPAIYTGSAANPFVSYLADMWGENTNPLVKTVLISASEVNFTLAEAAVRGWISGSAVDYYKKGIQASLDQYAIASGDPKVYDKQTQQLVAFDLDGFLANATTAFNSASDKLEPIMTQAWIANFGTADMAAWCNWRRTGYPDLGKNVINGPQGNKMPVRFPYGNNPKNFNGDNVNKAVQDLDPAVDDQWSKMWLLQGTGKPW